MWGVVGSGNCILVVLGRGLLLVGRSMLVVVVEQDRLGVAKGLLVVIGGHGILWLVAQGTLVLVGEGIVLFVGLVSTAWEFVFVFSKAGTDERKVSEEPSEKYHNRICTVFRFTG